MEKRELINFVKNNDFAYVYGAGIMYANDIDTRNQIADIIGQDGVMIAIVSADDIYNEGGCVELSAEIDNGCTIIRAWQYNSEPLYIAYYNC